MEGPIVGVYGILFMFVVLFFLRIPVGFTMALVGFLGFSYVAGFNAALGMIGTDMWNIFSNYGLTVIPMFILVGEFAHYGGYNNTLYFTTYKWFGHYRGGLSHHHDHGLCSLFSHQRFKYGNGCNHEFSGPPRDEKV